MSGLNNSEAGDVIGIYRETVQELYRFVSRRSGGSRELAEDITQETYLRAVCEWRNGRRADSPTASETMRSDVIGDFHEPYGATCFSPAIDLSCHVMFRRTLQLRLLE